MDFWPLAAAYLLGSVPFGLLLPLLIAGKDVRATGSGNIGSTNVIRAAGKKIGALVQLLDIGKGIAGAWLCKKFGAPGLEPGLAACAGTFAAVLGHCHPVWLKFRGGKGVNSALGGLLATAWLPALASLALFVAVFLKTRTVSLAALAATLAFPLLAALARLALGPAFASYAVALAILPTVALIVWRHRENIARLRAGTEPRVGQKPGA